MTVQATSDISGNIGPAKIGDADEEDVNLVNGRPGRIETEDITATVTSAAHPTSDTPTTAEFMSAVVAWPDTPQNPGWVALPYSYVDTKIPGGRNPKTGKYPITDGKPFKTVDELVSYAAWINTTTFNKDVWFCLSLQSQTKTSRTGKLRAVRTAANAISVKALWLDIDVGKEGGYATVDEALKAAIHFRETMSLPPFSAVVGSGGGIHV
jgi:hypothetical protein